MVVDQVLRLQDEAAIVDRARHGDRIAFEELYRRHADAAWRLALAVTQQPTDAADAVAEAFAHVLGAPDRSGIRVATDLRPALLAATRSAAIDRGRHVRAAGSALPLATDNPRAEMAAGAFASLPERSRSVLWLTEVEHLSVAEAGTVLAMSAEATEHLATRACAALHEKFVQAQLATAEARECRWASDRLGAYSADELSERDTTRVHRHLDDCEGCRDRLMELEDLRPRLHRSVVALPARLLGTSEAAWRAALPSGAGRLGLTLPGGHEVPAWAERVLAGATAAVVALGITGALITGGNRPDRGVSPMAKATSDQPLDLSDGESAAGGSAPVGHPDGGEGGASTSATDPGGSPDTPRAGAGSPTAPRRGAAPTSPGSPAAPGSPTSPSTPTSPTTPGTPGPTPTTPPPTTPPTTAPPVLDVTVRVDDGTGVTIGDDCVGVELLGIVVGCEPTDTGVTVPLLGGLGL